MSTDQSGEDRREYGGPEDRIMAHVIRNEKTVAHANKSICHGEADRTRDEVRGDAVPAQKGCSSPGVSLRPRSFSHDRGQNDAAGRRHQHRRLRCPIPRQVDDAGAEIPTDPTVLNTENTAHQYAANRARKASAMIMPRTAPPMAIEAKTKGCSWHPPG